LLDNGEIEWKGTLRKTFEYYFHPEKIDKESAELFQMLGSGRVPDLFQFSTMLGQSVVKKAKPRTLIETTAINSIMRLMSDGKEQPIDTFVKFKEDLSLWYEEMDAYGLTKDEQVIFEKHLKMVNGVADSQEKAMLLTMDGQIAGFDLYQSTKLRKSISKKKKEAAEEIKVIFFEQGLKNGIRKQVLDYAWHQIERMLGYSFSDPHVLAYTIIAFIQLNIFSKYNPIYWQTACLTVNSGSQELEEDDKKKDKNYGKVAEAIGKMKNYGVNIALPDINYANISFTPDADNNRIVYSLKGVSGMNDQTAKTIIENRPYSSFDDFYNRLYIEQPISQDENGNTVTGRLLQKKHVLSLIKAGAFNSFDTPIEIMKQFVFKEIDKKETLNMQNIKSIIRLGLLDKPEYKKYLDAINLRDEIKKKKLTGDKLKEMIYSYELPKKDIIYIISDKLYSKYQLLFPENKGLVEWSSNGIFISDNKFDKEYKKFIEPLKVIIASPEFVREFNIAQFYEMWFNVASGTVEKWEMEAVSYYSDKHELDEVNREMYNISNFFEIDENPEAIETYQYRGREMQKFKIFTLIGTVLDRNKDKHTFTLLTPEGVVTCKTYSGAFSHYDKAISRPTSSGKKETLEKSWFTRGNLLMVKGFRRGDQFVLRTNSQKGMEKEHTINLIHDVKDDGSLLLQSDRESV